jgi:hypothetical protein
VLWHRMPKGCPLTSWLGEDGLVLEQVGETDRVLLLVSYTTDERLTSS